MYMTAACLVAFAATALVLTIANPWAARIGLVDHPGGRKLHDAATPVSGGLALLLGGAICRLLFPQLGAEIVGLGAAAAVLLVVGVVDDLYDVPWPYRAGAQLVAAYLIVAVGGVQVQHLGGLVRGASIDLGWLSLPFTLLAIIGLINAFNMCDGSDGLAASLAACSMAMLVAGALYAGNAGLALDLSLTLGAALGFLVFNLRFPWQRRARAFLGNSGSAILGLVVAWGCFRLTQTPGHPVAPVLAPFLAAPPVVDCLVLMVRRARAGRSPFHADRNHIHHLMLRAGWTPSSIVGGLCLLSLALGFGAALWLKAHLPAAGLLLAFAAVVLGYYLASTGETVFERLARAKARTIPRGAVEAAAAAPRSAVAEVGTWPPDVVPAPASLVLGISALRASALEPEVDPDTAALVRVNAMSKGRRGLTPDEPRLG